MVPEVFGTIMVDPASRRFLAFGIAIETAPKASSTTNANECMIVQQKKMYLRNKTNKNQGQQMFECNRPAAQTKDKNECLGRSQRGCIARAKICYEKKINGDQRAINLTKRNETQSDI
jgi:hypothetical protein